MWIANKRSEFNAICFKMLLFAMRTGNLILEKFAFFIMNWYNHKSAHPCAVVQFTAPYVQEEVKGNE